MKGVKKIGVRLGNWLTPDPAITLLEAPDPETMKGKRDLALLAILVACGLRRHEAGISNGKILRRVTRASTVCGSELTEKVVWHVVKAVCEKSWR